MRVVTGNRRIARVAPLSCYGRRIAALQNIERVVRFAPDGDSSFAVAVIIILHGRINFRRAELLA